MPLTKLGIRVLNNFKKEYGSIEGEKIFYSFLNKKSKIERKKYEKIN